MNNKALHSLPRALPLMEMAPMPPAATARLGVHARYPIPHPSPTWGEEAKGRLWRDFCGNPSPQGRRRKRNKDSATCAAIACLCLGLISPLCSAVSLTVAIDTTSLAAQSAPPAPFSLDFQLIDGGGTATNTALLSHFDFGGGSTTATGCTSATCIGGASVTGPPLVVTLTDDPSPGGSFLNELVLPFTPGSSGPLSFQLDLTTNLETGATVSPDAFTLAILDSSGFGIPTDFFDVFVQIDITSPLTSATFASDTWQWPGIDIPAPIVGSAAAPEPGTLFLFASAIVGVALARFAPNLRRPQERLILGVAWARVRMPSIAQLIG